MSSTPYLRARRRRIAVFLIIPGALLSLMSGALTYVCLSAPVLQGAHAAQGAFGVVAILAPIAMGALVGASLLFSAAQLTR